MKYYYPHAVTRPIRIAIAALALPVALWAAEPASLDPHLEPLRPWLGKTWKEQPKESMSPAKTDIARWERALNGKAVRILHSIEGGAYGGETIVMWDEKKQAVVYHYFTTAGFTTTGTMKFEEGKLLTHEVVTGDAGGVDEVRGATSIGPDGTFRMTSEYLKGGKWQPARDATYREDATASVIFK